MKGVNDWTRRVAIGVATLPCFACSPPATGPRHAPQAGPIERPTGPLDLEAAGRYVLQLVNHDRAEAGLEPVEWDDTAAEAAQRHAEDMARHGFTGHWGSDGSVPEQRYTEAGGEDLVKENAACFFDGTARALQDDAVFTAVELEKIQGAFMEEVPPNDGHKQNILGRWHNELGVGLAKPVGVDQACLTQEFVDDYGDFDGLPTRARRGQMIKIAGEVHPPVRFGAVGIGRIAPAEPIAVEDLLETGSYKMPDPDVLYSPKGFQTPKPVEVDGNAFSIDVAIGENGEPGRYEVSIWGKVPDEGNDLTLTMISLRTIHVR